MSILQAFHETLVLAKARDMDVNEGCFEGTSYEHLVDMFDRAEAATRRNELFSEAKLNRWLGWAQACVVINSGGRVTLSDMKEINRRNK